MNNAKTKLQSLGFTSGHAQLLTVAVAIFVVLFVAKSGINWRTVFVHADDEPILTYDQALAEAQQEAGGVPESSLESDEEQIALLDRTDIDGKVLGEAIGIGEIPDADQLLLPEISDQLVINNISTDTDAARQYYAQESLRIEEEGKVTSLLADLNSPDAETLRKAVSDWNWVITSIGKIPVPPSLQKYNHDKLVYYSVLMQIGKIYAGDKSEEDLPLLTKALLSYSEKVETLRKDVNSTYNLNF